MCQTVSQYDLAALGFITPEPAFGSLDGIRHTDNVMKGILEYLHQAA